MAWLYYLIIPALVLLLALVGGVLLNGGLVDLDDGDPHAD